MWELFCSALKFSQNQENLYAIMCHMVRRRKKTSIIALFITFGIIVFLLLALSFFAVFSLFHQKSVAQKAFMDRISTANKLILDIDTVSTALSNWMKNWDSENYRWYLESDGNLRNSIDSYMVKAEMYPKDNVAQVQRLLNFDDYQRKQIGQNLDRPSELFTAVNYAIEGFGRHNAEIHLMFQDFLSEGYDTYLREDGRIMGMMLIILAIFFSSFLLLLFVFFRYSRSLLISISQMKYVLSQISKQNWSVSDLSDTEYQEFSELFISINSMKGRLREYFERLELQQEIERQLADERLKNEKQHRMLVSAQMDTLRSQINPHFLFNALNQIGMACLLEPPEKVMKMIESTGRILRYAIYNSAGFVPLSDEMDVVKDYIYLQSMFSGDNFDYSIDIPSELDSYEVLPMCIQPIVENSFKHGHQHTADRRWVLKISAFIENGLLKVRVWDNGPGFSGKKKSSGSHIGLENIGKRLSYTYGRENLLRVDSEEGRYAQVELDFLLRTEIDEGTDNRG